MERRDFIKSGGIALGGAAALAGCTAKNDPAPPRDSNVFESVKVKKNNKLAIVFTRQPTVTSRADVKGGQDINVQKKVKESKEYKQKLNKSGNGSGGNGNGGNGGDGQNALSSIFATLSPIGRASAKGRASGGSRAGASGGGRGFSSGSSRGFTGRGARGGRTRAPRSHGGWFIWYGGAYGPWYQDHGDKVNRYRATINQAAVARLAGPGADESKLPGAGPADNWDKTWVRPKNRLSYNIKKPGWYRVGANLVGRGAHDFGWEAVDLRIVKDKKGPNGLKIDTRWKVSAEL